MTTTGSVEVLSRGPRSLVPAPVEVNIPLFPYLKPFLFHREGPPSVTTDVEPGSGELGPRWGGRGEGEPPRRLDTLLGTVAYT